MYSWKFCHLEFMMPLLCCWPCVSIWWQFEVVTLVTHAALANSAEPAVHLHDYGGQSLFFPTKHWHVQDGSGLKLAQLKCWSSVNAIGMSFFPQRKGENEAGGSKHAMCDAKNLASQVLVHLTRQSATWGACKALVEFPTGKAQV